jgi:hypothetical protein
MAPFAAAHGQAAHDLRWRFPLTILIHLHNQGCHEVFHRKNTAFVSPSRKPAVTISKLLRSGVNEAQLAAGLREWSSGQIKICGATTSLDIETKSDGKRLPLWFAHIRPAKQTDTMWFPQPSSSVRCFARAIRKQAAPVPRTATRTMR